MAVVVICAYTLLKGPVRVRAAGAMILKRSFSSTTRLYVVLAMALSLGCWSFIRSEYYRQEIGQSFGQTFKTLCISDQARVGVVRIAGWLRLARETRKIDPGFGRQVTSIVNSIDRLMTFELSQKEINILLKDREVIKTRIMPIALVGRDYDEALRHTEEIEHDLSEIASSAAAQRRSVKEKAQISIAATRNRFIFALALVLVVIGFIIIAHRAEFVRRRDEYIRSFSLLHAHMTRSRIIALRLFLDYFNNRHSPSFEMLKAAQDAVKELEGINNGLMRIANSERDLRIQPLGKLLQEISAALDTYVRLEIEYDAQELQVPCAQVRLIVEEIVNNAVIAVRGKQNRQITIRASLLNRRFLFAHRLVIEIADSGGGMTSDILDKAATPFFSTRGGSHVGLGLTGCIEMVNAMRGNVRITSTPGVGTIVRILLPIAPKR
ncbi:sensor histidine kinase [Mesorhizobium caraganae]|uniref:sensor histidine kinase n=1 Tax=Mesorhizobium caraganae TaxID=483206 RepID=UPI0017863E61|nr:ATP-binding protein [Mesorhizobium caraganae]